MPDTLLDDTVDLFCVEGRLSPLVAERREDWQGSLAQVRAGDVVGIDAALICLLADAREEGRAHAHSLPETVRDALILFDAVFHLDEDAGLDAAERLFERAPDRPETWLATIPYLLQIGVQECARDLSERLTAQYPNLPWAWYHLGLALIATGKPEEGRNALLKCGELAPEDGLHLAKLASFYVRRHQGAEVLAYGAEAIKKAPSLGESWITYSAGYLISGHVREAEQTARRAVALTAQAWAQLCAVLIRTDVLAEAERAGQRALAAAPPSGQAYPLNLLGEIADKRGDRERAATFFLRAFAANSATKRLVTDLEQTDLAACLRSADPAGLNKCIREFDAVWAAGFFALRRGYPSPDLMRVAHQIVAGFKELADAGVATGAAFAGSLRTPDLSRFHFLMKLLRATEAPEVLDWLAEFTRALAPDPDRFVPVFDVFFALLFSGIQNTAPRPILDYQAADRFCADHLWPLYRDLLDRLHPQVMGWERGQTLVVCMPLRGGLSERDSISFLVLKFAQAIADARGWDIQVICSSLAPLRSTVAAGTVAADGVRRVSFEGRDIPIWSASATQPFLQRAAETMEILTSLQPALIVSAGNFNLFADLAARHCPVINIPLRSSQYFHQFSRAHALNATYKHPADRTRGQQAREAARLPGQHGRFVPFRGINAVAPAAQTEVDLPPLLTDPEKFVFCVVGNRLILDIDGPFIDLVDAILHRCPSAHVLLIGIPDPYFMARQVADPANRARIHAMGYTPHLPAVLAACDTMLNPLRAGGGHGAFMAMLAGLPVVAQRNGDTAEWIGWENAVADGAAFINRAVCLVEDPAYRQALARYNVDVAQELADGQIPSQEIETLLQTAERVFGDA